MPGGHVSLLCTDQHFERAALLPLLMQAPTSAKAWRYQVALAEGDVCRLYCCFFIGERLELGHQLSQGWKLYTWDLFWFTHVDVYTFI